MKLEVGCILLAVLVTVALSAVAPPGEKKDHRLPHERFEDEHFKDGEHDPEKDHEAFLGSKHDAEEFDQLSPEESKRRLGLLAKRIDTDKDGKVSKEELTAWIQESLKQLDAEEVDERFDEIDEDNDGKVSWEEYKRDAFGDDEDEGDLDEDDVKLMEEDRKYFDAADRNVDQSLDKVEFGAFQNPEHHDHMHKTLVDMTLKEKDSNGDGKISFDEFMGEVSDKPDSEWYTMEKERFENDYDTNKDGILEKDEMKTWLVPDISQTASEETAHLFKEADKNSDGTLTYQEIVDEHQLFVGSEATNYGEHLEKFKEEL